MKDKKDVGSKEEERLKNSLEKKKQKPCFFPGNSGTCL